MLDRSLICAACLASALFAAPTAAQVVDYSKYPAFKGQWFRTGPPNNWRQVAGLPPYTTEAQKKWEEIQYDLKTGGPGNWPSTYCIPTGMPAMMNLYNPMEVIITPEITYVLMSHNSDNFRRIYTDGRDFPAEGTVDPTFAGYSIGKWIDEDGDGQYDVLEVETRNLREPRAYDVTGLPFAGDGKTVIKERFYLEKGDPNVLWDDITVVDSSLTRPYFKHQKTIRTNQAWTSETCAADNNWVKIGDENYFVNTADGRLMPSKKGQRPPDLFYFNLPQK